MTAQDAGRRTQTTSRPRRLRTLFGMPARRAAVVYRAVLFALPALACGSSSAVMPGQDAGIDLGDQTPIDAPADDTAPGGDAAADAGDGLPAFPGAQGWAAGTPGGRGGQIVRVTTLSPGGPGSLAAALQVTGPKIIVFEVGGVIDLMGARYMVQQPFVTIAGQTAPSPGITIIRGGLLIGSHDVVVQHIRVRPARMGARR